MPAQEPFEYWVHTMRENLRWNPHYDFHFYPEQLEGERAESFLKRHEAYHRAAVDELARQWIEKQHPDIIELNQLLLLKERFRFAVPLLRLLAAPAGPITILTQPNPNPEDVKKLVSWALIEAWADSGASAFAERVSELIEHFDQGGHTDSILAEWLRIAP